MGNLRHEDVTTKLTWIQGRPSYISNLGYQLHGIELTEQGPGPTLRFSKSNHILRGWVRGIKSSTCIFTD